MGLPLLTELEFVLIIYGAGLGWGKIPTCPGIIVSQADIGAPVG